MDMETIRVKIKKSSGNEDIPLPDYMSPHASGMDLRAAVQEETILTQGEIQIISTGISVAIPPGFEAQVRPRSGLALKHGVSVLNTP